MLVDATYISYQEFNKKINEYKGKNILLKKPDNSLGWELCIYTDGQNNIHLLCKDLNKSKENKNFKKEIKHYAFDPYDPDRRGNDVVKGKGREAFKKAEEWCKIYGESLDYPLNKQFVRYKDEEYNIVAFMYHYVNRDLPSRKWYKNCYGYDMNSCYPYFMTKPLPYGDIIKTNEIVEDDELGFNYDLTVRGDTSFNMCLPGERATFIFKAKVYKGLCDFVNYEYNIKKELTGEERAEHKLVLNALVGIMKYHNVFMRVAILEYARRYMESLKDENTIMQTVDSIVSLKPRPELPISNKLGDFKLEHNAESFIWINDANKRWANSETSKTGLKKSRKYKNFQLIKPPYGFDFNKLKIIRQKEEWTRLWPEEENEIKSITQ